MSCLFSPLFVSRPFYLSGIRCQSLAAFGAVVVFGAVSMCFCLMYLYLFVNYICDLNLIVLHFGRLQLFKMCFIKKLELGNKATVKAFDSTMSTNKLFFSIYDLKTHGSFFLFINNQNLKPILQMAVSPTTIERSVIKQ